MVFRKEKMMKKVLVLILVLGMASLASATPVMSLSSSTITDVGETVTLTITGVAADATPDGGGTSGWNGYAMIDATNYPYGTYGGGGDPYAAFVFPATQYNAAGGNGALSNSYARAFITAGAGTPWDEATDVDVGVWFTIDIIGVSEGVTVVDLTNASLGIDHSFPLTVLPEPMTIGLLGLGGLLLRRRK